MYLEDRPDLDQEGTELTWEDVYEDGVEEEFDVAGGFDPANPVYLCNECYTYEDECQELVAQADLDAEMLDIGMKIVMSSMRIPVIKFMCSMRLEKKMFRKITSHFSTMMIVII